MDKVLRTMIALAVLCAVLPAQAAEKTVTVEARTRIVDGSREWHESRPYSFAFAVEVISDREGRQPEGSRWGRPFVTARPGEEYRVRVHNPLPVPVAANLSIDGLNSITGEPASPAGMKQGRMASPGKRRITVETRLPAASTSASSRPEVPYRLSRCV